MGKHRPKVNLICQNCGKVFETYAYLDNAKFCSQACQRAHKPSGSNSRIWKGGPVEMTCPHCGKTFRANRGDKRRVYCSKKCLDEVRMNRVTLTCCVCGKRYVEQASRANRYKHSFCSLKCRFTRISGSNSPTWRGGISFAPYPATFNETFKRLIRERDNYTCKVCSKHGNHVHHINYVKADTIPENCVTLCRSCHMKTNANREYWKALFA